MWIRKSDYDWLRHRVDKLETMLDVERAENRRTERHWGDMFLRRMQTFPVPKDQPTVEQPAPIKQVTDTDIAKYEAIKHAAVEAQAGPQEIADAVRLQTGWSEQDIVNAMRGS
jgi:hypothetical protein